MQIQVHAEPEVGRKVLAAFSGTGKAAGKP